jgi:intracellular sulfur oxidation DsrE/DsrF family protein
MKTITFILVFGIAPFATQAQQTEVIDTKVHNIVMQFTSGDSSDQASVVLQLSNIRVALPKANIEVVCHGRGLDLMTKGKAKAGKAVAELSAQGIKFAVCSNTMKRYNIKNEDLLPQAIVVPSAMVELVLKQEKGWAYLKGAR